jgi:hypothetical protein
MKEYDNESLEVPRRERYPSTGKAL